jgi:hypothetical protein
MTPLHMAAERYDLSKSGALPPHALLLDLTAPVVLLAAENGYGGKQE